MSGEKQEKVVDKYEYRPPVNSHFYYKVLSPFCQFLVEHVFPDSATPDLLTVMGLTCGAIATFAVNKGHFIIAGFLWQAYCIFDNCDGKQARRLNLCSHGGEFMDHACDSVITSLAGYVMISACLDLDLDRAAFDRWSLPFTILIANYPYFLGIWGQAAYGHVIMGAERVVEALFGRSDDYLTNRSPEWISVDEYNFMLVPGLCFIRGVAPVWFTTPIGDSFLQSIPFLANSGYDHPSLGKMTLCVLIFCAIITIIPILFFLLKGKKGQFFLVPFAAWTFIALFWNLSYVVTASTFSLLSFEVLVKQLKIHTHTSTYILYPILFQLLFIFDFPKLFNGASCPCQTDYRSEGLLALSTVGILFTYKNVIHARNNEPNVPWIILKQQQIQQRIVCQFNEIVESLTHDEKNKSD